MKPKNARLFCQTGALAGTKINITKDILIGRQPSCDLVMYPHTVSGKHARIFFNPDEGDFYIEDLGSSNGTWVDRVLVEKPTRLDALSIVTFAKDIDFIFQVVDTSLNVDSTAPRPHQPSRIKTPEKKPARQHTEFQDSFSPPPFFDTPVDPPEPKKPEKKNTVYQSTFSPPPDIGQSPVEPSKKQTFYNQSLSRTPSPAPPPKKSSVKLFLVVTTKGVEERFPLNTGKTVVGRSSSCNITISDPFISSKHAVFQVSSSGIILEDLNSSNKTYINGKSINKPVKLLPDMTIRFGPNSEAKIIKG